MEHRFGLVMMVAFGLITGCDASHQGRSEPRENLGATTLTLRGTNTEDLRAVPVTVQEVIVSADGRSVPVLVEAGVIDLARDEGHLTAKFDVPPDAKTLRVNIRFDDYGGYETQDGRAGVLDTRGTSMTVDIPAARLAKTGVATLSLDLARSLVSGREETRVLAPHFEAAY